MDNRHEKARLEGGGLVDWQQIAAIGSGFFGLAFGDAAPTAEENVRNLAEKAGTDSVDAHSIRRMMMSSSAWLPTMNL